MTIALLQRLVPLVHELLPNNLKCSQLAFRQLNKGGARLDRNHCHECPSCFGKKIINLSHHLSVTMDPQTDLFYYQILFRINGILH